MYIYVTDQPSRFEIESKDERVFCSLPETLFEHLRSVNGSNPCAIVFQKPLPEHVVRALMLCFPNAELIPYETAAESLSELRQNLLCLKPGFSVNLKQVRWIESDRRQLKFYHDGYVRTTNYAIGNLPFERLCGFGLVRCHESYIVNLDYVESLQPGAFVMQDGMIVPVSRSYSRYMTKYRKAFRGNTSRQV